MSQTVEEIKETLSCASLHKSGWTPERTAAKGENVIAAKALKIEEDRLFKGKKVIIDTNIEPWRRLKATQAHAQRWWDGVTFPFVHEGTRLFLREDRERIWKEVAKFDAQVKEQGRVMDRMRPEILGWAEKALGPTYDASLYPASWEQTFAVEVREHSIDPPKYLERADAEEYRRELQRTLADVERSMARFEQDCMARLGAAGSQLAAHLASGGNNGVGAQYENFVELFDRVSRMKFEGTQLFKSAMAEARQIIGGVTVGELKRDLGKRAETRERLARMTEKYLQAKQQVERKAAG